MKVRDIVRVIEDFAPLSNQESWDNSGLCIGSPDAEVTSVLLGLDCTPELVDEAVSVGADMIVTHHPLIFSGLKRIAPDDPVGLAVIKAVSAGISVYAAHTSADKVIAGVSGAMAARLGLEDVGILDPGENGAGLGVIGFLPEPLSAEAAIGLVKERFGLRWPDVRDRRMSPSGRWRCAAGPAVPLSARPSFRERSCMCRGIFPTIISSLLKASCSWTSDIMKVKRI